MLYASDQFHMQGACLALLTFDHGGNFGMFATSSLLFLKTTYTLSSLVLVAHKGHSNLRLLRP